MFSQRYRTVHVGVSGVNNGCSLLYGDSSGRQPLQTRQLRFSTHNREPARL